MPDEDHKLPPIGRPFTRGTFVDLTCEDRTVKAMVMLASANGRSLILAFDALLAGHAGVMPVLQKDDGKFVTLINGVAIDLKRISP